MDEYIVLSNGTTVGNSYIVGLTDENIAIYIRSDMSLSQLYELFGDPGKTAVIRSCQYGDEATWEGFTEPIGIDLMEEYSIIRLRKE